MRSCSVSALVKVLGLLLCVSCGPLRQAEMSKLEPPQPREVVRQETSQSPSAEGKAGEKRNDRDQELSSKEAKGGSSNEQSSLSNSQEMIDAALDLCEEANGFWDQGELESAIETLDKAYAIILKVPTDDDSYLRQQKEDIRISISKRIVEIYASRYTVATGPYKAIPLVMNQHVQKEIESFKGRERDFFLAAYRRSGRYRPAILKALSEAGLPKELSWLPLIESGFKVRALSHARALGMWQFIASTGYRYGLKRDTFVDERMDPVKSTAAAIAYLKELHEMFGDWTTALAAYNCGEWGVLNRIKTQRINYLDNFWDLYEKLPRETASYVPRFLAVLHIIHDPKAHGITLSPLDEEFKFDEVTIDKRVQVKAVAARLQIDPELLLELNAELRQDITPANPYPLKVPAGKGDILLTRIVDVPECDVPGARGSRPSSGIIMHKVRKGETLTSIAKRYRTSVKNIRSINGLGKAEQVKVGYSLKIPTRRGFGVVTDRLPPTDSKPKPNTIQYVVKQGDNLWRIATRYNTTEKEIRSLNQMEKANLQVGQVLVIAPGQSVSKQAVKTGTYKVKKGDTPSLIARKHEMELDDFLKLNNMNPQSRLSPGQSVRVEAP